MARALYESFDEIQIYGILDGYRGLIEGKSRAMKPEDFSGILTLAVRCSALPASPSRMQVVEEDGVDKVAAMLKTIARLKLDCLAIMGGNGTHKTANLLRENGVNVVTLPKTIDNDLWGTDMTFGFQSAVDGGRTSLITSTPLPPLHGRVFIGS